MRFYNVDINVMMLYCRKMKYKFYFVLKLCVSLCCFVYFGDAQFTQGTANGRLFTFFAKKASFNGARAACRNVNQKADISIIRERGEVTQLIFQTLRSSKSKHINQIKPFLYLLHYA